VNELDTTIDTTDDDWFVFIPSKEYQTIERLITNLKTVQQEFQKVADSIRFDEGGERI
jgi:hypothetical protein